MKFESFLLRLILVPTLVACSHGNCRENEAEKAQKNPALKKETTLSTPTAAQDHVHVYKYDGRLQCGMGKQISLDQAKAELKSLQIYSQQNKADSLMHIQQCGSISGTANIFEIDRKDLPEATKAGFKEWLWE